MRNRAAAPRNALRPTQVAEARRLRRLGADPAQIESALGVATEEGEKALVQMRSPRPETPATSERLVIAMLGYVCAWLWARPSLSRRRFVRSDERFWDVLRKRRYQRRGMLD
jgi:hypothetical protein